MMNEPTQIPSHSYPIKILLFWGIVCVTFIGNFLNMCRRVKNHFYASNQLNEIKKLTKNKKYHEALQLHEKLCTQYPQSYPGSHGIKIAAVYFECSKDTLSFFKKGINFLQKKKLNDKQFSKLYQKVPEELRAMFLTLFNVSFRTKNKEEITRFTLNNDKVKLL